MADFGEQSRVTGIFIKVDGAKQPFADKLRLPGFRVFLVTERIHYLFAVLGQDPSVHTYVDSFSDKTSDPGLDAAVHRYGGVRHG